MDLCKALRGLAPTPPLHCDGIRELLRVVKLAGKSGVRSLMKRFLSILECAQTINLEKCILEVSPILRTLLTGLQRKESLIEHREHSVSAQELEVQRWKSILSQSSDEEIRELKMDKQFALGEIAWAVSEPSSVGSVLVSIVGVAEAGFIALPL